MSGFEFSSPSKRQFHALSNEHSSNQHLEIRHNIEVSKNVVDATNSNYSADAKKVASTNEFTKSFCDTDQYKNAKKITEITRDSVYQVFLINSY